jgi:hypothetical protein
VLVGVSKDEFAGGRLGGLLGYKGDGKSDRHELMVLTWLMSRATKDNILGGSDCL